MNQEQTISLTLDTTSTPLGACARCSSTKLSIVSHEHIVDIDGLQFAAGIPLLYCQQCGEARIDNAAIQRFNFLMIEELERLGIHPACADWVIGATARMRAEAVKGKPQFEYTAALPGGEVFQRVIRDLLKLSHGEKAELARLLAEDVALSAQGERARKPVDMFSRFEELDKELAGGVAAKPQPKKCKACGLRRVQLIWKPCGAEQGLGGEHGSH